MRRKNRSRAFSLLTANRYFWHSEATSYTPDCYQILSRREWKIMQKWFAETDQKYSPGTGECGIPAISLVTSLVNGNGISRAVQLGHYIGYSTLLIGAALKRAGRGKLASLDIDPSATEFSQKYVHALGLDDFVSLYVTDSRAELRIQEILQELGGAPQLLFIDSSHQEDTTYEELLVWVPLMAPGGIIVLNHVSKFSRAFDATGKGGVNKGMQRFIDENNYESIRINENFHGLYGQGRSDLTYIDGCGVGIIHIPPGER